MELDDFVKVLEGKVKNGDLTRIKFGTGDKIPLVYKNSSEYVLTILQVDRTGVYDIATPEEQISHWDNCEPLVTMTFPTGVEGFLALKAVMKWFVDVEDEYLQSFKQATIELTRD